MDAILNLIGLDADLFAADIASHEEALSDLVRSSRFLVIGGAGSIGQAVTKEIFARSPKLLHVVDISENNMVELVRDIRSLLGYIEGELREQKLRRQGHQWSELCRKFWIKTLSKERDRRRIDRNRLKGLAECYQ